MPTTPESYYVGDWLIEPSLQRISKNGERRKIEPQLMAVLQQLAGEPGKVVTKNDLRNTVWADVIVTENVLTRAISSLRKSLSDDPLKPEYIETISKTGYRLIAEVKRKETTVKDGETFTIKLRRKPVIVGLGVVLLLALGAFATRRIFLPISFEKLFHPQAIANYSNAEYWPAISPDGKFVAYGWKGERNDNWDIYARLIGTETILRITDDPATDLRAKWSPEGNYIYYLRYENGGATLFKKPILGGEEVRILDVPQHSFGDFDVSPDEKWISFNDKETVSGPLRIKLISLETGEETWLTEPEMGFKGDIHPTFSRDGRKIAFIREKNPASMNLWLFDLRSKKSEQVTSDQVSINGFDWSSDDNSLLYSSNKTGLYKLWEVVIDSKSSNLMPVVDYQLVMPRVAETGRMVYAKMVDNVNIWSYEMENKTAKTWKATNDLNLNGKVSPDGTRACFTMNKDGIFQLWVCNIDGSGAVPITSFVGQYLTSPTWTPDSKSILFQGFLEGQSDIYKVNALGGVPDNLTKSGAEDHTPFFAADQKVYFSSNRSGKWGIWSMEPDGSGKTLLIENNAYGPQLSKNSRTIYYSKKDQMGLWEYSQENEKERLIIADFHPMFWGAFSIAKDGIYYLNPDRNSFEFLNLQTGQSSVIYQPRGRIPRMGISLDLSPDAKQLLFSQIDANDADIMLLEELQ